MKKVDESVFTQKLNKKEYNKMVEKASPNSPILRDCFFAFLIGGLICTIAQLINMGYMKLGITEDDAASVTSMSMIFIGAFLTGINVYDDIAVYGGAGTLVPITGFANGIVSPAMEYKTEGYVLGVGVKMFTIAGPVLVFGIVASVVYGIIYNFII